jgi:hypothetical protein
VWRIVLAVVSVGLPVAAVPVEIIAATAAAATPKNPTAAQMLKAALNASQESGSVRFVDQTTVGKQVQKIQGVISAPTAGETLSGAAEPLVVELIGGTVYVKGSAPALESALQISKAQGTPVAGEWISVSSTDAPFQSLTQALTISATLSEFTPASSHVRFGKIQTVAGHRVRPIIGPPSSLSSKTSGSAALFVSPKAPYLPQGGSLVLSNGTQRLNEVAVFTNWGAKVSLTAPSGSTAFSSVLTADG